MTLHKYEVGDKVRIKKREGAATDYPFCFNSNMANFEGKIFTISSIIPDSKSDKTFTRKYSNGDYNRYILEGSSLNWHSSMFEPVEETRKNLALNDKVTFGTFKGEVDLTIISGNRFYYLYFSDCHSSICKSLHKLPWFESLAEVYNTLGIERSTSFPKFHSLEDLDSFIKEANSNFSFSEKEVSSKIDKQYENNAIKFQKPKTSLVRGSVPEGHRICSRRNKTAISIGHLSNRACNF